MCRTPNGKASLRIYRDLDSLEELRNFWSSHQTAPTGHLDFYRSVTCASPEFVRPHVVVLFLDNQPQSLLLGRLERRRIDARLGYLRVPVPKLNVLTFDDCGWLRRISAGDSEFFVGNILTALRDGEADAATLQHLDIGHPLYELAISLPKWPFADHIPLMQVSWMRRLPRGTPFLEGLSANERSNHRRRARRLLNTFHRVEIGRFHDDSRLDILMRDAETIAAVSYQRGLGVGFANNEGILRRLRLTATQGILRAYILYLDEKPAAFWITSYFSGTLYNDFLAHDPVYGKYGPGTYLVFKVIEEITGEGSLAETVDFGPGDAEWKSRLGTDKYQLASLYIFAPTAKGAAINLGRIAAASADRSIKAGLQRAGVLTAIKRRWRKLVTQSVRT